MRFFFSIYAEIPNMYSDLTNERRVFFTRQQFLYFMVVGVSRFFFRLQQYSSIRIFAQMHTYSR